MTPLIVGNWKMYGTVEESLKRITEIRHKMGNLSGVEVAIAPPFTALYSANIILQETAAIKLSAQNMHWETEGAFTGEISGAFLKDLGCSYVIVGHSERRHLFGETNDMINKKVRAALAADLIPILCLGETSEQRSQGKTGAILEDQLKKALVELHMNDVKSLVVAYEPVWAIGTGQNATPEQIGEVHSQLRNLLAKGYDAPTANEIRLLYGGSVNPQNAKEIAAVKDVDGMLVGGASLDAEKFLQIARAAVRSE